MRDSYKKQVDDMGLFGKGVCHVCGEPGYHDACDQREFDIENEYRKKDDIFLKRYSVHDCFGVHESSRNSYKSALEALSSFLSQPPDFDETRVIEGHNWWYFPNGWIGVMGFIVEKGNNNIYSLGSGLSNLHFREKEYEFVAGCWVGIEKYLSGELDPVVKGKK
jgi:hypothetical protein